MGDPTRYLSEESYRPEWLKDGVTEETLKTVLALKPELARLGRELAKHDRFYLVGSGGSYGVQFPVRYVAEKYTDVPVYQYSAWEFLERRPEAVREGAVCVFISQSGRTREVLRAAEWAAKTGARTVGLTQRKDSAICKACDYRIGHEARGVTLGKLTALYLLFGTMLRDKGFDAGSKMMRVAEQLPTLLPPMILKAQEIGKYLGLRHKDDDRMFVVGGGVNWGLAYQFAMCTLQEMCWVHATPVHYSEFRHGPIEMFTPGSAAVFLRSRGTEGDLERAVQYWADKNGVRSMVFDSQSLEVDNLATPFTLFVELEWLSYYLSLARNRDMESWRYYDKVEW